METLHIFYFLIFSFNTISINIYRSFILQLIDQVMKYSNEIDYYHYIYFDYFQKCKNNQEIVNLCEKFKKCIGNDQILSCNIVYWIINPFEQGKYGET